MPEQILMRKAAEYKKEKNYDMAIECLKKANELMPYSPFAYTRENFERLVDFMVIAKRYDDARKEHKKLDNLYGTRIDEYHRLQEYAIQTNVETRNEYQQRVIDPYIEETRDKECYYWLLENIPSAAPKSFGSYRRMKNQNTESYKSIERKAKENGYDLNTVKFWY